MIKDDMKLSKQDLLFRALTILGAVILYIFAAYSAHAGQNFEFYRGIRQMGMGGASIAVVNDETALLANPAGLGKLRDYIITVADPEVDVGSKTQAIIGCDQSPGASGDTGFD